MSPYFLIVILILLIHIIDNLITAVFCFVSKRYYHKIKYDNASSLKNNGESSKTKFLRKIYSFYTGWIRYKLRRLGEIPCHLYRILKLKYIYQMKIEKNVVIYGGFEIRSPWNIEIGKGSVIGDEVKLDGRNGIKIGENVNFSTGVWIWTEQHDINDQFFSTNSKGGEVAIDNHAWISARTTILPRVHIGEGTVIASGAVVTKNCNNFEVYGGIPAKKIGERNTDLRYSFDGSHLPFY